MVSRMNAFTCACFSALLAASSASAKKGGASVSLGVPHIEYVAPRQTYTPPKTPASVTLTDLLAKTRSLPTSAADLQLFAEHTGYKLVVDKGKNKLYLLKGDMPLHVFDIYRSRRDGDKRRHGDLRTPEGLFLTTSVSRETAKGFLVWIGLNTAGRARADYLREHGATGRANVADFERRHGAIIANHHVGRFNEFARKRSVPFMWGGIGLHAVLAEEVETQGCVALKPQDALFVHDVLRGSPQQGREVPVLILPSANYPSKSVAPIGENSRGSTPMPISRNAGLSALSPRRRVFRRRQQRGRE